MTRWELFLSASLKQSGDPRPFVRQAVTWAWRQIGKRNQRLNTLAVHAADLLKRSPHQTARWIGSEAFRELTSPATQRRLKASSESIDISGDFDYTHHL